ncbi:MAG: serine/threonine-protein kinase [Thermoanaerobaculia bacterium]|nr:serine/threonine-protein kinase [Thermoanaerobaculia bacterium]
MTVAAGTRLGPYEIVAPLGAGGMGEVFRGRDTRLGRDVAIKILPDGFAQNEQFRARFEREAKTISSLNHPNICTLFDVGHEEGTHFLVMELIEGESLADRLQKGPLPLDQVLRYGSQVADALERAHKQGIVHRDLKPGNVMITKTGAKLLDFGLARPASESAVVHGMTEMPTQARPLTQEGTILGTFQYMAPEQLEGQEADARTDIFSLGALLYEMATGKRAFEGSNRTSLIAAIVSSHPAPISSVAPMAPPALDHIVKKCLEKDPDDRWQSAHDVASELRWLSEAGSQAGVATTVTIRRKTRERLAWGANLLTALLAIAGTWAYLDRPRPPLPPIETAVIPPKDLRVAINGGFAIAPDTSGLVVVMNDVRLGNSLWLRRMDSAQFRPLPGTEDASHPFWSPDSRQIAFFANGKLKAIDAAGGNVRVICDAPAGRGGSWGAAGSIILAQSGISPLVRVPAEGGAPQPLSKLDPGETSHRWPYFLPDGKRFIFVSFLASGTDSAVSKVFQSSLDEPEKVTAITTANTSAAFVPGGYLLFGRDNVLYAQRYDPDSERVEGEPTPLTDRIAVTDRFLALFTVANDGTLVLQRGAGFQLTQLAWVDRSGRPGGTVAPPGLYFCPTLSHDQKRVAVDVSSALDGQGDIWVFDLERNVSDRLTFDKANESSPLWTPDDKKIVYYTAKLGTGNAWQIASGGTGQPEQLVTDDRDKRPTSLSRDGRWIVFNSAGTGVTANTDIWIWSADEKKVRAWLATPFVEQCAQLSPDAKWIAYQSDETGRHEVYVRAFPDGEKKWRISSDGGMMPAWRGDGRELYYVSLDRKMMAVAVTPETDFAAAAPVPLFDAPVRPHPTRQYDVSPDGQRFLLNRMVESDLIEPIAIVQNWQSRVGGK